jgi:ribosomal protein S18 acetylase RimI-like enzyme
MTAPTIRTADSEADLTIAGGLIACALHDARPNQYLVPDPARRQPIMSGYFRLLAEHAASGAGEVLLLAQDGQIHAVTVWFDHTTNPLPVPDYEPRLAEIVPLDLRPRFAHLDKTLTENHPAQPHAYLAFVAVRRPDQGKGLGTALLTATHDRLDTQGLPAYLEATDATNQALYRRLGYTDLGTFTLEDGSPFHPMWRLPATPPNAGDRPGRPGDLHTPRVSAALSPGVR